MEINRRAFVATNCAALASGTIQANQAPSAIPEGKDHRLGIVAKNPLVLETPDPLLAENRITPTSALFVRQHHGAQQFNSMQPGKLSGWTIRLANTRSGPAQFDAGVLVDLPRVDVEMVLQCSGNNRAKFSKIAPIKGTPWDTGGIGNVVFGGVKLADVFRKLGIEPKASARFLTAAGKDNPENADQADFEHSLPLDECMEHGMLATHLNGDPMPMMHGGPVRLVMPGYYGSMHIKWLDSIAFDDQETKTHFQMKDYRLPNRIIEPGAAYPFTSTNSSSHYAMNVNSRFFSPTSGASVRAGAVQLTGVAWNDGRVSMTAVEVSTDAGQTWQRATMAEEVSKFAWRPWSATVALSTGRHEAWVRAIDALGRSQPLDGVILWNPGGYGWNVIDRVSFNVGSSQRDR